MPTTVPPLDYYLLPRIDMAFEKLLLAEDNGVSLDTYRFETSISCSACKTDADMGGSMNDSAPVVQMIPVNQIKHP